MNKHKGNGKFDIIVTLNHRNVDEEIISKFIEYGATIFRVNTSFIRIDDIERVTKKLRSIVQDRARILLDLPGAKIRFSHLEDDLHVQGGIPFKIEAARFNHPDFLDAVEIGSELRVYEGMITLTVSEKGNDYFWFIPSNDVVIRRGKGLHLGTNTFYRPHRTFSDLDDKIIEVAASCELDYLGLSFVADSDDVRYVQDKLDGTNIKCIPKIEAKESVKNLYDILRISSKVIVDRGDLAGETGINNVWRYQRHVIAMAHLVNTEVIIATQFFSSMVTRLLPTLAEIDSLYSLLDFGFDGVQLSDETCVGKYAVETVKMLNTCVKEFNSNKPDNTIKKNPVVWIMGPTSSGKTTIAKYLGERFSKSHIDTTLIDGDEIRDLLGDDLGFSQKDRLFVIRNIVHHAKKNATKGSLVVVSALTAHPEARQYIQQKVDNLIVVYLKCSIDECIRRDPKRLYAKALKGKIDTLIGINQPYKDPEPDMVQLTLDTKELSAKQCADRIIQYLISNKPPVSEFMSQKLDYTTWYNDQGRG